MHSRLARDRYFNDFFRYISNSGQFSKTRQFIQHGDTSVYSHCVAVAYVSLWFSYRLHGFTHPKRALINATADWNLSDRTQNIILRHMFPLTPVPPACREAWLVCLADKVCALAETFHMTEQFFASIKYPYDIKNPRPW